MAKHETANEFMGVMFLSRDVAHREHLKTKSYAAHKALQKFYEGIVEKADSFAETFQGRYDILLDIPYLAVSSKGSVDEILESHSNWIVEHRADICPRTEAAIHNIIDEILALYYSTLYKLRFLS
jgi:hypothetical protein